MIGLLEGVLQPLGGERVLVRTSGGVGYVVACSSTTVAALPAAGERVELRTHLVVREDALDLYGFHADQEHALFLLLLGVQAVGPKVALAVLSSGGAAEVAVAIATGDAKRLQAAPGVGRRTAERIVVDLKDRLGAVLPSGGGDGSGVQPPSGASAVLDGARAEALAGLEGLGFAAAEAEALLRDAVGDTAAALLSDALRRSRSPA